MESKRMTLLDRIRELEAQKGNFVIMPEEEKVEDIMPIKTIKIWCNQCGQVTRFSLGKDEPDGVNVCLVCRTKYGN